MTAYRPGQGKYARGGAAGAALLLALFASDRVYYKLLSGSQAAFKLLGVAVPYAALWAAGLFVLLGALVLLFTLGVSTGIAGIDSKARALIDLLIDTESELNKVSWPGRTDLTNSTTAVLVSIFMLGGFLFAMDLLIGLVMRTAAVLPG